MFVCCLLFAVAVLSVCWSLCLYLLFSCNCCLPCVAVLFVPLFAVVCCRMFAFVIRCGLLLLLFFALFCCALFVCSLLLLLVVVCCCVFLDVAVCGSSVACYCLFSVVAGC